MSEDFEKMSVVELRKAAKDLGVKLGAGINKQGIIEKLKEARGDGQEPEDPRPMHRPIRSASIRVSRGIMKPTAGAFLPKQESSWS